MCKKKKRRYQLLTISCNNAFVFVSLHSHVFCLFLYFPVDFFGYDFATPFRDNEDSMDFGLAMTARSRDI